MKSNLKVAVVQAKVPSSWQEGEQQIRRLVKKAVSKPVDILGLPEDCVAPLNDVKKGYDAFKFLSNIAREFDVYLFGANIVKENRKIFNKGFLFDNKGKLLLSHKKIVLTPPEEKIGINPGRTLVVVNTKFGRLAILVCKDAFHRYAAWFFDKLKKENVDVVLVPSYSIKVSERSINLWVDTLKSLSMWFDLYIVSSGTIGKNFSEKPSFGHAMIVSPKSVILAEGSENKEEVLYATLKKRDLQILRSPEASKWQPNEVPEVKINKIKSD